MATPALKLKAAAELELRKRRTLAEKLLDFVPRITPRWESPRHLQAIADALHSSETEPVRALVSVPPRHGKTELLLHAIAWWLRRHPEQTVVYASYSADIARSKSRLARDYARAAGVRIREDSSALTEWRTPEGGGLLATGVGGPLTGHGCHLLIVDDPHKNRQEAESQTVRDSVHGWFTSTALSRIEPGGAALVVHTRWHPDDLIGRLQNDSETSWSTINLPAINVDGNALWPSRWPVEAIQKRCAEVGEYDAASLYYGNPRPKGGIVFGDPVYYDQAPTSGYRVGIGLDLAYSKRTKSDYSVAVVLLEKCGVFYVTDVIRKQVRSDEFAAFLGALRDRYRGVLPRWYCSGTEVGVADLLRSLGCPVSAITTSADKFVRAQPCAAAWNASKVQVPQNAPWLPTFLAEVLGFTGVNDPHDDQVDSLAAAFDSIHRTGPKAPSVIYDRETYLDGDTGW
jgi:predicted phage terminase large subunit-like protein